MRFHKTRIKTNKLAAISNKQLKFTSDAILYE